MAKDFPWSDEAAKYLTINYIIIVLAPLILTLQCVN